VLLFLQGYFGIDCSIDLSATESLRRDPVVELDMPENDAELLSLAAAAGVAAAAAPAGAVQQRLRPAVYVYELPTWLSQAFEARAPRAERALACAGTALHRIASR
jgi:hypothetical protein